MRGKKRHARRLAQFYASIQLAVTLLSYLLVEHDRGRPARPICYANALVWKSQGAWLTFVAWRALRAPSKYGFRQAFHAINYYAVMVMGAVILDAMLGH
jgi:hypothetical protein